jgi:hypothetical protein
MISGMRQGLTAAPGWDAVTGFGSINFERMLRYVLPGSDAVTIASFVNNGAALFVNVSAIASATAAAAAAAASSADVMKQLETFRSIAGYAALSKTLS